MDWYSGWIVVNRTWHKLFENERYGPMSFTEAEQKTTELVAEFGDITLIIFEPSPIQLYSKK